MRPDSQVPSLDRDGLRSVFEKSSSRELIGLEVECAALDPRTGRSIPFEGDKGIHSLLEFLLAEVGGEPEIDCGHLVGMRWPDSGLVSLEHSGAVEYSSPPATDLVEVVDTTRLALQRLARAAERFDFALVPGANYPFTAFEDVRWTPHARGEIMRDHFMSLGADGAWGPHIMSMTLSTQVSFDYSSLDDLVGKLRMQAAVSTPATALFVNSPLENGVPCGALSRRMQYWSRADPARTRVIPVTLRDDLTIDHFIDWALSLPMIHRSTPGGSRQPVAKIPFATLLAEGFDDGTSPDLRDWSSHLSQIFPDVRLRGTLELRAVDGPPYSAIATVPAFWSGLTYDSAARTVALELVRGISHEEHLACLDDIARRGLRADLAGRPVGDVAAELLRISESGLRARIAAGMERPEALSYLDPLWGIVESRQTFAEQFLALWNTEWNRSPERFVQSRRIQ